MGTQKQEVELVKSEVDGNEYLVLNLPDKQKAANILGELNLKILKMIKLLERDYPDKPEIQYLKNNYKDGALTEASENGGQSTSYTINKKEVFACLRNSDGTFVDFNTLTYVVLIHEVLGHCGVSPDTIGHVPVFWQTMGWMKERAIEYGIYKQQDFGKNPLPYCGIILNSGG